MCAHSGARHPPPPDTARGKGACAPKVNLYCVVLFVISYDSAISARSALSARADYRCRCATPPLLPQVVQCPLGGPCKNHNGKACLITRGTANQSQISKNFSSGACATNAAYYLSLHVLKVVAIGGNPPILCRSPKNPQ